MYGVEDMVAEPTSSICENLLLFSDIEGCMTISSGNKEQHQLFCDSDTFYSIYKYLLIAGNHVGFCGDFFDQGPKMGESIIGMAWLRKHFPDQVHIILGNRDINKKRIKAEMEMISKAKFDEIKGIINPKDPEDIYVRWKEDWINNLPADYDSKTPAERIQFLLEKTFGAPNLLSNLRTEFVELKSDEQAIDLFRQIFTGEPVLPLLDNGQNVEGLPNIPTKNTDNFVRACKIILYHGMLIKRLQVGEKQVLLSHAGSPNPVIYSRGYINMIEEALASTETTSIKSAADISNYHKKLEYYRARLVCIDGTGDMITTKSGTTYNLAELVNIEDVINKIHELKQKAYTDMFKPEPIDTVSAAWLLVQAMGIGAHPDPTKEFPLVSPIQIQLASPIQSCILKANCNEPIPYLNEKIIEYLKSTGNIVDVIVLGHIPFCGVVPIICAAVEGGTLIFVALDTSNGNNPKIFADMTIANVPLAYLTPDTAGVGSLNPNGTINMARDEVKRGKDSNKFLIHACRNDDTADVDPDYHRGLVQTYDYSAIPDIPTINMINELIVKGPKRFQAMREYKKSVKEIKKEIAEAKLAAERVRKDEIYTVPHRDRDDGEEPLLITRGKPEPEGQIAGNKNKSKNKRLRKCRKCLMCCNGSCDYNAKLTNTKRGSRKQKKARKTIKKSNNSKQRTRKQKKARKHKK